MVRRATWRVCCGAMDGATASNIFKSEEVYPVTNIAEISHQRAERKQLLRCQRLARHMDQEEQRMVGYINTELARGREPEDERLLRNRRDEILRGIERRVTRA